MVLIKQKNMYAVDLLKMLTFYFNDKKKEELLTHKSSKILFTKNSQMCNIFYECKIIYF